MKTKESFLANIESELEGLGPVSIGLACDCEQCDGEEDDYEPSFSWSSCDSCGSSLGGDRYPAHVFGRDSEALFHLDICVDCAMFHANGELPHDLESKEDYPEFAFPGGYRINYLMGDGEVFCAPCVWEESQATKKSDDPQWRIEVGEVYWEGPTVHCANCNKELPSEYGDPEELEIVLKEQGKNKWRASIEDHCIGFITHVDDFYHVDTYGKCGDVAVGETLDPSYSLEQAKQVLRTYYQKEA